MLAGSAPYAARAGQHIDEGEDSNVSILQMSLHMDAPLHFFKDGADITTAPFEVMLGPVRVARIEGEGVTPASLEAYEARSGALEVGERLFFKTDNSAQNWPEEPFNEAYVAVDADAVSYLASKRLILVGVNYRSVAPFTNTVEAHLPCSARVSRSSKGSTCARLMKGTTRWWRCHSNQRGHASALSSAFQVTRMWQRFAARRLRVAPL